ncbi:MAG: response regulator [Leptospiraceae bacterium]|nr:response regulator [Leptospiraceae bacterium]MCP5493008.1 response regulator [Leptospiraceae bacterium]
MEKILIIEDEEPLRNRLVRTIELEGYHPLAASGGIEGIKIAKSNLPDLIICDIMMPDLDGYGVYDELKKHIDTSTIPFIFLTAKVEKSDIREGMNLGADDYITKPFDIEDLMTSVKIRLEKKKTSDVISKKKLEEVKMNLSLSLPYELITPLINILGTSEQLKSGYGSMNDFTIREMLDHIHRSGKRLQRHMENYLLYVRLEVIANDPDEIKKLQAEKVENIKEVLQEHISLWLSGKDRKKDVQVNLEDSNFSLNVNLKHLRKIVEEILDNSIRYSLNNTPVEIQTYQENGLYYIVVTNQGEGMSEEQIQSIGNYEVMKNIDFENSTRGFGLDIVKRLIQIYGGDFHIDSKKEGKTIIKIGLNTIGFN